MCVFHAGTTTMKSDFKMYGAPGGAAKAAVPRPALQVEKQPFNAQSTYKDTFIPMVSERAGV